MKGPKAPRCAGDGVHRRSVGCTRAVTPRWINGEASERSPFTFRRAPRFSGIWETAVSSAGVARRSVACTILAAVTMMARPPKRRRGTGAAAHREIRAPHHVYSASKRPHCAGRLRRNHRRYPWRPARVEDTPGHRQRSDRRSTVHPLPQGSYAGGWGGVNRAERPRKSCAAVGRWPLGTQPPRRPPPRARRRATAAARRHGRPR